MAILLKAYFKTPLIHDMYAMMSGNAWNRKFNLDLDE